MTKILIETTGEFELLDYSQSKTGLIIRHDRPTVSVDNSHFVSQRAAAGQIKVLGTVNDEASDEEFQKYWDEAKTDVKHDENATDEEKAETERKAKEDQKRLAVDSFSASFVDGEDSETAKIAGQEEKKDEPVAAGDTSFTSSTAPQRGRKANV